MHEAKSSQQSGARSTGLLDVFVQVALLGPYPEFTKKPKQSIHLLIGQIGGPACVLTQAQASSIENKWFGLFHAAFGVLDGVACD